MDKPIFNPSLPYIIGPIQPRFIPGKIIKIQGTALSIANRFNINLQCGSKTSPQDDIALQVSVRLLDGYIALNSLQHSIWDEEQRNLTLPIKRAERFEISFICEFNQYKVDINGQHYCEFPQRIHYDRISHLAIDGDVSIIQISCGSVKCSNVETSTAPPLEYLTNGFELTNFVTTGFTQPPSYETAISGSPYPTSDSNGRMPQPRIANSKAYPPPSAPGLIIPFNRKQSSSGPSEETIPLNPLSSDEIPLSSSDTPVSFNTTPNSYSHSIKAYEIFWLVLLTIMIAAIVTIIIYAFVQK